MLNELRVTGEHWAQLREHLLPGDGLEHAAYLICGHVQGRAGNRLVVRQVVPLGGDDLLSHGQLHLSVNPVATARVSKVAKAVGATVVLCHSHPFGRGPVRASRLDRETEADLCGRVLTGRLQLPVGALVMCPTGVDAAVWSAQGMEPLDRVRVIGDAITTLVPTGAARAGRRAEGGLTVMEPKGPGTQSLAERVDRQVRAWGRAGQEELSRARVGIVGCGGTGSHVVQQLVHLGLRSLVLVDPDTVAVSNLSRIVGSTPNDVGRLKVDVLARSAAVVNPQVDVVRCPDNVLDVDPAILADLDVIFACTDGHGSRALLNGLVQQFLVPVIDMGVEVVPGTGGLTAGGGVRVLRPGRGCLLCAGTLDSELVRQEYLGADARELEGARGYLRDAVEPAPSVIALNGVVASLAVLEACQMFAGMYPTPAARLLFRGQARRLTTTSMPRDPACYVCGDDGLLGAGEGAPVATRWREDTRGASGE